MSRVAKKASNKPTGPCSLCASKTASSWRRIPRTVPEAAGQSSCNACYVYILKRTGDPDSVSAALEACRSAKRTRTAPLLSDKDDDEEDSMQNDSSEAGTPRGGSHSEPILPVTGVSPAARGDASCSKPAVHGMSSGSMFARAAALPVQLGLQQAQRAQQVQPLLSSMQPQGLPFVDARTEITGQPFSPTFSQPFGSPPATPQQPAVQPPAARPGPELLALREACWRLTDNPEAAHVAFNAACQLPGLRPEQLGVLPATWLLLPGTDYVPQPAGALLLGAWLPPAMLPADAQEVLLRTGTGLARALRVVVYCRQTGQVLQRRDWLQCDDHALYTHPRHEVPTWDSSEGWKLLFPEPDSDTSQARLFEAVVGHFGAPKPVTAQPSFLIGSSDGRQQGDGSSSCTAETASPHRSRQSPVRHLSPQQQQQHSPPLSQQRQQQQQQQASQLATQLTMQHSLYSLGQPGPQLPAVHGDEWGQHAALLPPTFPQLTSAAASSFRRMADSLQPQPQLQPLIEQQQPHQQQRHQQLFRQQAQQAQQWVPEQQRGQSTLVASRRPDPRLPSDLLLPSAPGDPSLAAGLLCGAPLDLLDDDLLEWIINLGSGTAPAGSLPALR